LSSWVANEGQDNETVLALLRSKSKNRLKIVKKNKNRNDGEILKDVLIADPQNAYNIAIAYMKSYPYGYREAMIGK
jgi:hypothetical protein